MPTVHRTLNSYSALEHHQVVVEGGSYFGQSSTHYVPADLGALQLPKFPALNTAQLQTAEYLCVFPSTWVSATADHFRVTFVEPVAPDHTRLRWEFFFVGERALQPDFEAARQALAERVLSVFEEDVNILERLQSGRHSSAFDGGCFSAHHEGGVHRFQQLIKHAYQ